MRVSVRVSVRVHMAFLYLFKFGYSEGYCSTCVTVMLLLKTIDFVSINSARAPVGPVRAPVIGEKNEREKK